LPRSNSARPTGYANLGGAAGQNDGGVIALIRRRLTKSNAASARRGGSSLARRFAFRQMESETFDAGCVTPRQCQRGRFQTRKRARLHASRDSSRLKSRKRRHHRLPSSKLAVSILQLWCTLTFMQVDARLAFEPIVGSRRATWPRKQRRRRQRRRLPRRKRSRPSPRLLLLRHIKARAPCHREADIAAA
jgi:hypothetical protein